MQTHITLHILKYITYTYKIRRNRTLTGSARTGIARRMGQGGRQTHGGEEGSTVKKHCLGGGSRQVEVTEADLG